VSRHFAVLARELESHMVKEEEVLFPYVASLACAARGEHALPPNMFGTVQHPIRVMEIEHENAGRELALIRELTRDYQVPSDGCSTYRVAMEELRVFEEDLHVHVHLENHVLFPRAIELEARLSQWVG
jgi:regulator of cell morphogenesis and NO signaling